MLEAASAFIAVLVLLAILRIPLTDDAYITLDFARTLATSGTWGMYPGHPSNAATSPLNVILTAAVGRAVGSYPAAVVVLSAMELTAAFASFRVIAVRMRLPALPWVALTVWVANPLLLSSLGLEGVLFATLLAASSAAFVSGRHRLLGGLLGLLVLTRPDGGLLAVLSVGLLAFRRQPISGTITALCCVVAPWCVYSWIHLGSLIPDTFFIKIFQTGWEGYSFRNGLARYFHDYPVATAASFVFAPLALFALGTCLGCVLVAFAVLHFAAYSLLDVPPYHWYYLPEAVSLGLAASLTLARPGRSGSARVAAAGVIAGGVLAACLAEAGFPLREPLIHTNWASTLEYRHVAESLDARIGQDHGISFGGEVGTLAFYSRNIFLDPFTDTSEVIDILRANALRRPPVVGLLMRLNFLWHPLKSSFPAPAFRLDGEYSRRYELPETPGALASWTTHSRRYFARYSLWHGE